jgi:hypothetical protein
MPGMAVTKLSDGRLQVWAARRGLFTSWQTSLDPHMPWTPLIPFDPAPPGGAYKVAGGHSPDGRAQLWTISVNSYQLQSTWKTSFDPDSGWTDWQAPFIPDPGPVHDVGVGQLSDGRMQLWVASKDSRLLSIWKASSNPGAAWTSGPPLNLPFWQAPFIPDPGPVGGGIAAGHSPDGRVQLWVTGLQPGTQDLNTLESTWKASGEPDSAWFAWQNPFLPNPGGVCEGVAVGNLSDGRMQLWAIACERARLLSTWKTSRDPGASWSPWQDPFIPDPGAVEGVAVGQLSDGRLKLWVIGVPGFQTPVLTSEKKDSTADAGWTDWQVFGNLS